MKKLFILLSLSALACTASAQQVWTSGEFKYGVRKGLNVFADVEYRTQQWFADTERWVVGVGADYKVLPFLKVGAGYNFIWQHTEKETTRKGNIIPGYWRPKHRASASVTGSVNWGRFSFSLRERYQYTYRPEKTVAKYAGDGVTQKSDEVVAAKHNNVLRSRLQIEWNIKKKCPFTPYVSAEMYNSLNHKFDVDKCRYTAGCEYKVNKKNSVELFYRYIDHSDDDEAGGNVIGLGYTFKL